MRKKEDIKIDGIAVYCSHNAIVEIKDLKPNPENPNTHPIEQIGLLSEMIRGNGWRNAITVSNRSGFIVKGHGRYLAAKEAGLKKAPVDYQDYETDAKEYADLIGDNKISEFSIIDQDAAKLLIESLDMNIGSELNLNLFGYTDDESLNLFPEIFSDYDDSKDDIVPDAPEKPKTKLGDLYKLGDHRLLCGDATIKKDVARLMAGQKADMVFTDPPYGVNYEGGHFHSGDVNIIRKREKLKSDNSTGIYDAFLNNTIPVVDGPLYMWFAGSNGYSVYNAVVKSGCEIHALIIWHKINATYAAMNSQYMQRHEPCLYFKPKSKTLRWIGASTEATLWELKRDAQNDLHPTQKPVALSIKAIGNHKADRVADWFGGSGSTLIACEKLGRKCFMMEIDPIYCDVIVKRWEDYTGKKAKLIKK